MQNFELGEFLKNILPEYKDHAHKKNIQLTIVTDFASHITLRENQEKIKFLLDIIIKSTIDHSEATSVNFSIRQLLRCNKEILLEFSLEDNGCLARSSKKFSYFRSLVIARSLIEDLNGRTELIQSPECGTVLKFVISCLLKDNPEAVSCHSNLPSLKGKKILIVDDNDINQKTIIQFLKKEDIDCSIAFDGVKAIELLEQNNIYQLILLDMEMPRMDGVETANYIRKKLKNLTPIVAMTLKDEASVKYEHAGIDGIIKKPFAAEDLLKLISSTLSALPSFLCYQNLTLPLSEEEELKF